MDTDFNKAFVFTIGVEGVISNNPDDTGGFTIYGISSKWFPDVVKKIKEMLDMNQNGSAVQIAKGFYNDNFWQKYSCMLLPCPVNVFYFDSIINEGDEAALSHLQKAVHWYLDSPSLNIDVNTVQSIATFLKDKPIEPYVLMACTARTDHYLDLVNIYPNDLEFYHGWNNRVRRFRKTFMTSVYQ